MLANDNTVVGYQGPCACIGRVGDDPYCPCEMYDKGLTCSDLWSEELIKELNLALDLYEENQG